MKISVMGCGRWGSFIAWYLERIPHQVTLYGRKGSKHLEQFRQTRFNGLLTLDEKIYLTDDMQEAVERAEMIVVSISAQSFRVFMKELEQYDLSKKCLILCMKGIESDTGKRLTEIAKEYTDCPLAIWVGPGHVQDFTRGIPNCMVIDSQDQALKIQLVHSFSSHLIRFYYGDDLLGNEIGAASKNVIGIAAGMLDGKGKTALKGALMSRGTREIARLIHAMGGKEITAYGLGHLGDYQATVFSEFSHNRKFGELYVQGMDYGELAEGVATTKALLRLGEEYHVELPICKAVYDILYNKKNPDQILSDLFLRSIKMEF